MLEMVEKLNIYMNINAAVGFPMGRLTMWSIQIYKGPAFTQKDSLLSSLPRALEAFYQTILSFSDAVFVSFSGPKECWRKSLLKQTVIQSKEKTKSANKIKYGAWTLTKKFILVY